ncbi:MAG: FG-GAP repeat domain-containing protein [Armatimonadota bacterium]
MKSQYGWCALGKLNMVSTCLLVAAMVTLLGSDASANYYRKVLVQSRGATQYVVATAPTGSWAEVPHVAVTYGTTTKYFISTANSYSSNLKPNKSILLNADALDNAYAYQSSYINLSTLWRRNYYGVHAAQVINVSGVDRIVAFLHAENKNELRGGTYYDNTIQPPPNPPYVQPDQYSRYLPDGSYVDYFPSYFAMITMAYCPVNVNDGKTLMNYDQGPVVWPTSGYLNADNTSACYGLRHPSSVVHGSYIYLYYVEQQYGQLMQNKVARAPVSGQGLPGTWKTYYNGSFSPDALPAGFTKATMSSYLKTAGGSSTPVLSTGAWRFSVANINGTSYAIGVDCTTIETGPNAGHTDLGLRVSTDMVHWSERTVIPSSLDMIYPLFANSSLKSNNDIDANNFYVMTYDLSNGQIACIPLSISIKSNTSLDYNNDQISDVATYNTSTGNILIYKSPNFTTTQTVGVGGTNAKTVSGDFNGDGITDTSVYDPSGIFIIRRSPTFTDWLYPYVGGTNAIPVSNCDYNGDGITDCSVYDPTGIFIIKTSPSFGSADWMWITIGGTNATPVAGDWSRDGISDACVYDPSGVFVIRRSPDYSDWLYVDAGATNAIPVTGDFNGDGTTDLAVYDPPYGDFIVRTSPDYSDFWSIYVGGTNAVPISGDWNGDGITDCCVYDPTGVFIIKLSPDFTTYGYVFVNPANVIPMK